MREGLKDVDVVMMLRLQKERMDGGFIPSGGNTTTAMASIPKNSVAQNPTRSSCTPAR